MKEIIHDEQITQSKHRAKTDSQIALISGMLAGVAGLLTFLTVHALWIMPIWFILPMGLLVALLGGAVVEAFLPLE
jgi:membrane associated rhomboid family serine protease